MKTPDRFEFIRLFVRIAECGSLWTAAQSVGVSQPAVSSGKVRLFGVKLVRRSTYDLALTDAGTRFLSRHRQIAGCPLCARAAIERPMYSVAVSGTPPSLARMSFVG